MTKVALIKCESYQKAEVDAATEELLSALGGLENFIKPGSAVVLKANLVDGSRPDEAVTTHPEVISALGRRLKELSCRVIIADSPGGPYSNMFLNGIYNRTGMSHAAEECGAELNRNFGFREYECPDALVGKRIDIIDAVTQADAVINVCKLKTHMLTGQTGAVKNLFGLIPGMVKVQMHGSNARIDTFCDFIIDIERFIKNKIVLHVMDAVVGMEGNGPKDGTPRAIGRLLASVDPYALDKTACRITGGNPSELPILRRAAERGITSAETDDCEVIGESVENSIIKGFKRIKASSHEAMPGKMPKFVTRFIQKFMTRYPKLKRKKMCKGCRKCFDHCPPKAITIDAKNKAHFDLNKCIRCYCCQELCPHKAIKVKTPWFYKLTRR